MFKGTVNFEATIKGNGIAFPSFEFNPNEPTVTNVEIEAPNGKAIRTTIHFASVASVDDAVAKATDVNTAALNRIAFQRTLVVEPAHITGHHFVPLEETPGVLSIQSGSHVLVGGDARMVVGLVGGTVKAELEIANPLGERNYGLFRSALQATSPVEEFMLLYNLLLMLHNDSQADVDSFILREEPGVPTMPSPRNPGAMETVYTRLRNEVAHRRPGVKLENTRTEIAGRVAGLRARTKRAIELNP